jgi:hypothetical protein
MEYADKLAEEAVKEAIQNLVASGKRAHSQSVPPEAQKILLKKGRGRISRADVEKKIGQALEQLRRRKDIKAPTAPHNDWAVLRNPQPPPTATTES